MGCGLKNKCERPELAACFGSARPLIDRVGGDAGVLVWARVRQEYWRNEEMAGMKPGVSGGAAAPPGEPGFRYSKELRLFLSQRIPHFDRVAIVESGSRQLLEDLLPGLYELYGPQLQIDLITCYAGAPAGFRSDRGRLWRITDYPGPAGRARIVHELQARHHSIIGILCSNEPIMTKWKWMLALRLPAKLFVLNENGDYFWVDYGNWRTLLHFVLFRAGLKGPDAVVTLGRLLSFPLAFIYLLAFAGVVHLRRRVRA